MFEKYGINKVHLLGITTFFFHFVHYLLKQYNYLKNGRYYLILTISGSLNFEICISLSTSYFEGYYIFKKNLPSRKHNLLRSAGRTHCNLYVMVREKKVILE